MAKSAVYLLPFPPSVNGLYRNVRGRGRVKTDRYREWLLASQGEIIVQGLRKVEGKFEARLFLAPPDNRRRDLDNSAKSVLDCLTALGLVEDDSLCERLEIQWDRTGEKVKNGVLVEVEAVE